MLSSSLWLDSIFYNNLIFKCHNKKLFLYCRSLYMIKKLLFSFFLTFLATTLALGQVADTPFSWNNNLKKSVPVIELPPLDLSSINAEDNANDVDKSQPWRYGVTRPLELDLLNSGIWTDLPNGDKIWQLAINSPEAINLSFNFEDFYLPEGSRLHFFNEDRTDVSKPYTVKDNRESNILGSWFVRGETIIVEYYEPATVTDPVRLLLGSVIHGYRLGMVEDYVNRGLNDSGDCNYDVNCPIGSDFDDKKDALKKTVALLNLGNGYICSASLVNNTRGDKTPYLLTGNHCLEGSNPALWSIRFNWTSPDPVCGTGEESLDLETNFTMSGAELRANNELSDFALVELYNSIPESWDVAFAGWDNTDVLPSFEVGIHHPNGDIMKVSRDDTGAVHENANGVEVWLIGGVSTGGGDGWEIGTTESGSSGSPLFDQNGRLIGQLYAGQSNCDGLENNNDYDIYGRFAISWDAGSTPEKRLKDWLDPLNSGVGVVETLQNLLNVPDTDLLGTLSIYPNPTDGFITIENFRYPNLSYSLYDVVGKRLQFGDISSTYNVVDVNAYTEGVYFVNIIDNDSQETITKKIIIDK